MSDSTETEAKFAQWQADCEQYRQDVAAGIAAADDPAVFLAELAEWNAAAEESAAAALANP